jgi:hypothetical protein
MLLTDVLEVPVSSIDWGIKYPKVFLGDFAKLRKATISFVMSVCPSVRMEQPGSHWTDFD